MNSESDIPLNWHVFYLFPCNSSVISIENIHQLNAKLVQKLPYAVMTIKIKGRKSSILKGRKVQFNFRI